ncbi:hypothetical protein ACS8MQ_00955 [Pseudomonas sp. MAHUQ-62]|uniref:hypothetical protein n=1 Tax=Pseudomonas sp. GCM10023245 TaxID=3252652 RepID=UPI00360FDC3C
MKAKDLLQRVSQLLKKADEALATRRAHQYTADSVDEGLMAGLRTSSLSFISMTYGVAHSYYSEFESATRDHYYSSAIVARAILLSIQGEIEGGWVFNVKKLIAAEIFSDFLEMAEYLLKQGYKDPAAVMAGSVLEESLRQLCVANDIEIESEKDGKLVPHKADRLNSDLVKAEAYTRLDQKSVTAWLDLRNNAAHGKYDEYTKEQVDIMLRGVLDFLVRVSG